MYTSLQIHVSSYLYIYMCLFVYIYIYIYIYIYLIIYICIYTSKNVCVCINTCVDPFSGKYSLRGHSFLMQIVTHLHPRRDLVGTIRNTHASAEALASPRVDAACPLHK